MQSRNQGPPGPFGRCREVVMTDGTRQVLSGSPARIATLPEWVRSAYQSAGLNRDRSGGGRPVFGFGPPASGSERFRFPLSGQERKNVDRGGLGIHFRLGLLCLHCAKWAGNAVALISQEMIEQLELFVGPWLPLVLVVLFFDGSLLIIWRLEAMTRRGVEGTVLGTLFMPYFSGLGNLIFVWVVLRQAGPPGEVAVNGLVNNITNLGFLLAVPALIWGLDIRSESKKKRDEVDSKLHRLSLALTLATMIFFSLVVWVLSRDGVIDRWDGAALVGLFLFWQLFHVYEVLKENTRRGVAWSPVILLDVALILGGSYLTLISVDGIVSWILERENGFLSAEYLGVLTGFLMVLPNAVIAFYYARQRRADVVYASQAGDGHISIPLCIGLFAIFQPMPISSGVATGLLVVAGAAFVHLLCVGLLRRLPKVVALALIVSFGAAVYLQVV